MTDWSQFLSYHIFAKLVGSECLWT